MKKLIPILAFLLLSFVINSQSTGDNKIVISGKVLDAATQKPIEFATISFKNETALKGTTSDRNGNFSLEVKADTYTVKIEFLSYSPKEFTDKTFKQDTNLGTINLRFSTETLDEVAITAQKDLVELKVDKKIYNASKDISNFGGNALDVLNNAPAVRIDDEGNAILRGANATVLIDGKPILGLDNGSNILSTIPSNSISKVEIITRSAKYSAEGGGGILNIITKKRKGSGLSGSLDLHLGSPDNNGASVFLNENTDNINIFSTISFNNETKIIDTDIQQTYFDNTGSSAGFFDQVRKDENQRNSFLFNIGSDFYLSDQNTLTTSLLINTNNKNFSSNLNLNNFDAANNLQNSAMRTVGDFDDISKIEAFLNYTTKFVKEGHQFSFDFKYDNTISENKANILENKNLPLVSSVSQRVSKDQDLDNFLFQLDYTYPLTELAKIEFGAKTTFRFYENNYQVTEFDPVLRDFVVIGGFNDLLIYDEKVHAFYAQYGGSSGNFSYSLGLRTEISDILIGEETGSNAISKKYTDLFPTASFGFEFENESYLSLNYSRSIIRPNIPQLNPFISLNNERFQSVGNPGLNPFYENYFELLYDLSYDKLTVASSVYANLADDQFLTVIQNNGLNDEGLETFIRTPINSGDKSSIGVDIDLVYRPFKGLRLASYISPYNLKVKNTLNNLYDFNSWVWYAEASALVSLNNGLRFQANYYYQSPIQNGLTALRTLNFINLTASKDLLKKKANISFNVVDLLNSKKFSTQSFEANTNTLRSVLYQPQFTLAFTYRFKQKRSSRDRSSDVNKDDLEDKQDKKM